MDDERYEDDEPPCMCGDEDCPVCGGGDCWTCRGEGYGVTGEDWSVDPLWARTWQTPGAVRLWAEELGKDARAQLAARPRLIVPVTASAGDPVGTLDVQSPAPSAESAA